MQPLLPHTHFYFRQLNFLPSLLFSSHPSVSFRLSPINHHYNPQNVFRADVSQFPPAYLDLIPLLNHISSFGVFLATPHCFGELTTISFIAIKPDGVQVWTYDSMM